MVAFASELGYNQNRSQFFVTMNKCEELNLKYPIFGKITDNTIFNLLRMTNLELDENSDSRPVYPPKIVKTIVVENPFDDIIPRKKELKKEEPKKKEKLNLNLLSIGDDEDEEEIHNSSFTYSSLFEREGKDSEQKSVEELKNKIKKIKEKKDVESEKNGKKDSEKVEKKVFSIQKKKKTKLKFKKKRKRKEENEDDGNVLGKSFLEKQKEKYNRKKKRRKLDGIGGGNLLDSLKSSLSEHKLVFDEEDLV